MMRELFNGLSLAEAEEGLLRLCNRGTHGDVRALARVIGKRLIGAYDVHTSTAGSGVVRVDVFVSAWRAWRASEALWEELRLELLEILPAVVDVRVERVVTLRWWSWREVARA